MEQENKIKEEEKRYLKAIAENTFVAIWLLIVIIVILSIKLWKK